MIYYQLVLCMSQAFVLLNFAVPANCLQALLACIMSAHEVCFHLAVLEDVTLVM